MSLKDFRLYLQNMYHTGQWQIKGALGTDVKFHQRFQGIYFDPFSRKTNPEMFDVDFLSACIKNAASEECAIASYSVAVPLKRALSENGFKVEKRDGFKFKRQCLWALRKK